MLCSLLCLRTEQQCPDLLRNRDQEQFCNYLHNYHCILSKYVLCNPVLYRLELLQHHYSCDQVRERLFEQRERCYILSNVCPLLNLFQCSLEQLPRRLLLYVRSGRFLQHQHSYKLSRFSVSSLFQCRWVVLLLSIHQNYVRLQGLLPVQQELCYILSSAYQR